ncbi:biotin--[acetyl-CoA-carboxylase] ligase [Calothrix sp. PCC 6303]|uniref:biotin--[acetyl-CoA-carboxylase] ligase n=1 Tax=Calothrix sp. PCC 6303 TaxID=1170562 RepID=UPI0002A02FFE|nr:biotin--[acetyl-CoA-carboxylase] ligase [Calothrix sp. PCC 6303]AFZ02319.1 biotin/acetyl-CoA-carboxylase ligase [Calothrix sp. PCC 6303]
MNQTQIETLLNSARSNPYLPFSLHLYDNLASTNQTLWELGAVPGKVVIATEQTAGRGQWGKNWVSNTGGLYLSVAVAPNLTATDSYQLTFATAWGIAQQLRNCDIPVEIKWPNDLILDQLKLGGILTETKINQGKITQAVIGVGINWRNSVPDTGISLELWRSHFCEKSHKCEKSHLSQKSTQSSTNQILEIETLICKVLLGIESGVRCLFEEGIDILLPSYLNYLTNMGDKVNVDNTVGTVVGVTSTGCLHVRMETSKSKSVRTPEIYLKPGTISLGYGNSTEKPMGYSQPNSANQTNSMN